MADKLRVGVIFGGRSTEHDVSVMSAKNIITLLNSSKFQIVPIGITREGQWLLAEDAARVIQELTKGRQTLSQQIINPQMLPLSARTISVLSKEIDIAFPVLHGRNGEDGTVQGLLEMLNIPYVGCNVLASSLAMDKAAAKSVLAAHRIPVVGGLLITGQDWEERQEDVVRQVEGDIRYPCFVKPANAGSSTGVSKVNGPEALREALTKAANYDRRILVEEAVEGREIEVAVLGNEKPFSSMPGEIVSTGEFYDYGAKYTDGGAVLHIPADLPVRTVEKVRSLALKAYQALDCSGMARVDFFIARSNKIFVNEINTIPGFTPYSMYPKLWEHMGIGGEELVERLIELALERRRYRYDL